MAIGVRSAWRRSARPISSGCPTSCGRCTNNCPAPRCASRRCPTTTRSPPSLDDRLDVALVTKLTGDVNRVRLERLFDDELRAVVNARHPLASRASLTATDFADVHLVLCDSYDQTRTPTVPLPIPPGARPARLTTIALGPDLLIETVATSDAVTVMPSWVVAPYLVSHDVVSLAVGDPPQRRTWYSATRPERSELVDTFVAMMHRHLAGDAPRTRAVVPA